MLTNRNLSLTTARSSWKSIPNFINKHRVFLIPGICGYANQVTRAPVRAETRNERRFAGTRSHAEGSAVDFRNGINSPTRRIHLVADLSKPVDRISRCRIASRPRRAPLSTEPCKTGAISKLVASPGSPTFSSRLRRRVSILYRSRRVDNSRSAHYSWVNGRQCFDDKATVGAASSQIKHANVPRAVRTSRRNLFACASSLFNLQ